MGDFWKSILLVWLPVGIIASLIHYVIFAETIDDSSYILGMAVVIIAQALDSAFGLD